MSEEVAKSSRAWLLNFGNNLLAAVGHHEMWQVLISPKLFDIPLTTPYSREVLIFQNRILPVLEVSRLLKDKKTIPITNPVVGIAVYQNDPTEPIRYSGLHLATVPQNIYVSDDQACDLPANQDFWDPLALSCFFLDDKAIPIIDLAYLFSEEFNINAN
jgi:chemotaxis signal transduction protein